jgi:hypothetical protein
MLSIRLKAFESATTHRTVIARSATSFPVMDQPSPAANRTAAAPASAITRSRGVTVMRSSIVPTPHRKIARTITHPSRESAAPDSSAPIR